MSITITDSVLLGLLRQPPGDAVVQAPDGEPVAAAHAGRVGLPPPGWKSPFTDERLAELRKQRDGRPLSDILRDIGARP